MRGLLYLKCATSYEPYTSASVCGMAARYSTSCNLSATSIMFMVERPNQAVFSYRKRSGLTTALVN
jgi:hypothetical protein